MFGERSTAHRGNPTILETLGADSWLVQHPTHGRCVLSLDDPAVVRSKQTTLSRMRHPGVRRSLGTLCVRQGTAHLATHLSGVPLSSSDWRRYHRRPREAARLGVALLEILEHAHERGVVHGRIATRHVVVGERVGLVGFGQTPTGGRPQDDLDAVGGLLFELVTGEPWTTWSPPASYFAPEIGHALDDWLAILIAPDRNPPTDRLRAMLRAVGATMPPPAPVTG